MICEVFFTINGTAEEKQKISLKIAQFLDQLENSGDIDGLSGTFEETKLEDILK